MSVFVNRAVLQLASLLVSVVAISRLSIAQEFSTVQTLPNTGQRLTPLAPAGARFEPLNPNLSDNPEYLVGQAVTTVVSPDRRTLLILTSGYNLLNYTSGATVGSQNNPDSNEYVFVFDISSGTTPIKKQVLQVPNTYNGISFDPSGSAFYVSGGADDNLHVFSLGSNGSWSESANSPVALGHLNKASLYPANGLAVQPCAAGNAITSDGKNLVIANYYNDSVTILANNSGVWTKSGELDLRPGKLNAADRGVPGGEYPFWVSIKGDSNTGVAYVSSIRDREIDVLNLGAGSATLATRIKLRGQPNKMTMNAAQTRLYVAEDETDTVAVIDTGSNQILETIAVTAPDALLPTARAALTGANTNSVSLTPDEKQLYVTNGNMNNVAVIPLNGSDTGDTVAGLIPTGWYPNSVSFSSDGAHVYVVNGKSPTGPNPGNCHGISDTQTNNCAGTNQYNLQLIKAGFQTFPRPPARELGRLTSEVATNNRFSRTVSAATTAKMAAVRRGVKHVIFIIKENRTYDQVLGDLEIGNGDPDLTEWGETITPNMHNLARKFVTLDNFYDTSEVSMDGWPWTVSARAPDVVERQVTVNYAGRGLSNDSEGTNRNVNVALATQAQRTAADPLTPNDPDVLPGQTDTAAPDGPDSEINTGYIWDAAIRARLSVRNYGFFIDLARYNLPSQYSQLSIPELTNPAASKTQVAYPTNAALAPNTDLYFRGFDNSFPDYYRFQEWSREFETRYGFGNLPSLSLVRFMHDHTGNFSTAILGVNTPELQEADNDYAVGLLVQKVAHSRYRNNTLIFVIEDDSQDGADHVDSHRSIAFVAGAYVKQGALISTSYNTIDFVRTIESVLGLAPLNLNDSLATPMADLFTTTPSYWDFRATPSALLYNTQLPLPPAAAGLRIPKPVHDASYWANATKGMDFSAEDRMNFDDYNHILWTGEMGSKPYPAAPSGKDLRVNRKELLAKYHLAQQRSQADREQSVKGAKASAGGDR